MPSRSTNLMCLQRTRNTAIKPPWPLLQVLPVTLAVILGPLIAILYHLTQSTNAVQGSFSLAQATRGLLCVLMALSLLVSTGRRVWEHRFVHPLLFLAIYAVLTSFAGSYPYENIVFAVKIAFIVLVFASAFAWPRKSWPANDGSRPAPGPSS